MRTCKVCNIAKEFKYIGLDKHGNNIHIDNDNKRWMGNMCYPCFKEYVKKKAQIKRGVNPLKTKTCVVCSQSFKQSNVSQIYCSKKCSYKASWDRVKKDRKKKVCKNCSKEVEVYNREYCSVKCYRDFNRKPPKLRNRREELVRHCITCSAVFYSASNTRKFCSSLCAGRQVKKNSRVKQKLITKKNCLVCLSEFTVSNITRKYCSVACSKIENKKVNKRKKSFYKKLREMKKKQRVPKWANLSEIAQIYANCPKGMHVDHIIPLNGKDVCGLHVEYNLQYLSETDNVNKSNKFDFTYHNSGWKS